jgi:hypothetical protein
MDRSTNAEWSELLRLLLAQRLELNAVESALQTAGIVTADQIKELRQQTGNTAKSWSSKEQDDVLRLIRIHSMPEASMQMPPAKEQ